MPLRLTAVFEKVSEGYIGFVEELPGANTEGATLEEARANLEEAVDLILEANRRLAEESLENRPVIREPFAILSKVRRRETMNRRFAILEGIALGECAIEESCVLSHAQARKRMARWLC